MSIKIVIVEDHPLVIGGLRNALQESRHIEIVSAYTTGAALLAGLEQTQPDVLLLDIQLPDQSGMDLARVIAKQYPDVRILVLTSLDTPGILKTMMLHGCRGYLLKSNTDGHILTQAIEQVYAGDIYLEPSMKDQLLHRVLNVKKKAEKAVKLTHREKEVLQLIVAELTNQEIADKLCISLRTVENHRYSLLQKLDVKNTAGLVKVAMETGLVE